MSVTAHLLGMDQGTVKLICTKDVAHVLGCTPRVAATLIRTKEISGFKLRRGGWRTTRLHLDVYISRSLHEQAAEPVRPRKAS